ncbi:MAG: thiamine pyrophosphate-binding protein [Porticoccaceae bacterium]|nr:thiamine pyrophosphate-binding protein [Porticoccaceae bacterium]
MNKTGAWLVRYALEQLGIAHTFGIPGIANAEIYDELEQSSQITPHLVNHEMSAAFMADALSRTNHDSIGTMLIVSGAALTHSLSGIGEAYLAGVPMLIIAGSTDYQVNSDHRASIEQNSIEFDSIDQQQLLKPLTKAFFKITDQQQIIETFFSACTIATSDKPGPVFIEIPLSTQIASADIDEKILNQTRPFHLQAANQEQQPISDAEISSAAKQLLDADHPGLLVGWGAVEAQPELIAIAEQLGAPVSTTLSGISSFPAQHPQHAGMLFGPAAVPSAENAFENCDCLLAIGTSFNPIDTASGSLRVPKNLVHINSDPQVFNRVYPATNSLCGDIKQLLTSLLYKLQELQKQPAQNEQLCAAIASDKSDFKQEWHSHNSKQRVNPALFFDKLQTALKDDAIIITDDGNHTFLAAELMPINNPRGFISPSNFNAMGYCVPAVNAAKLANPDKQVIGIVGDGAMLMSGMEALTAVREKLGTLYCIFNDGHLSRISHSQEIAYNQKTCTQLGNVNWGAFADALECGYFSINNNNEIDTALRRALETIAHGQPVFIDIAIDYSKRSHYAQGVEKATLAGFSGKDKLRLVSRAIVRKIMG